MSLNRLPPAMRIEAYKTYNIAAPLETHWTAATCEQVDCPQYLNGWAIQLEILTPQDQYMVRTAGRKFVEHSVGPGQTWLVFEPGQPCFRAGTHMRKLERDDVYGIRAGDWRGDPTRRGLQQVSTQTWLDDSGENQQNLHDLIEKHG